MPKEDYLQLQIETLGKFLSRVIAKFKGKETQAEIKIELNKTKADLNENYKIDFDNFIKISSEELIEQIKNNSQFNHLNMEYLAELIQIFAESETNTIKQQDFLKKSLAIYLYLDKIERIYSIERDVKIKKLKSNIEA